ncbi:threonine-phosphate decarboxylase CobD [Cupriavidus sp. AU9028]|uniref:threonine-phosphate decarboxylase CobD n=1 Tax=Cupriavidus sp. AU9028 TaxID=2871157 RepID=UPI001C989A6A|nr:threonine-phosphate decarboxylase CobD [Cupriavidus sp. AU9028]MBY4895416.1 threonine-phosphate decarboxylase CobD [Cupriavidus sp. AU9028]
MTVRIGEDPAQTAAPIRHGGDLLRASQRYGRAPADWLDLSTGINPDGYPVPPLPADCWQRLPQDDDGLAELAATAYGAPAALPVAGSQAAIRLVPALLPPGRTGIAGLGYSEYAPAFAGAGHQVVWLDEADFADSTLAGRLDHLVVVNPNNPTGRCIPPERLLMWHDALAARGGTLLVDEAFADAMPQLSVAAHSGREGLVVLRSLGKFYGLAGVRCGFVLASPTLLRQLAQRLGHWSVSGPARAVARLALNDLRWQAATRGRLQSASQRLDGLLHAHGLAPVTVPLFAWFAHAEAPRIHEALARRGIWTRLFDKPPAAASGRPAGSPSLRLGLPPDSDAAWSRLADGMRGALQDASAHR